jgi:stage II sporulation protein GA (sporulation sigma-E factor processing peptidase)
MEQTVYLDLLFFVNFSMDFLCFYITAKIMSISFSVLRVSLAATLGGIYADAALFLPYGTPWSIFLDIAVCFIICALAFYRKKEKGLVLTSVVYFSVSMALGGFMTALFNLLNRMGFNEAVLGEDDGDGISVWLFALIALVSALLTLIGGKFFRGRSSVSTVRVEITYKKRKSTFKGMVDSGNFLRDPISGRPCIVVDSSLLRDLFPKKLLDMAEKGELSVLGVEDDIKRSIRLVPASTATGEKMMIGVRSDMIRIDSGRGFCESDAIVVISRIGILRDGACALVPAEILK